MASRPRVPLEPRTEEEVQSSAINALRDLGFEVLQTSRRRKLATCEKCKNRFRPKGGDGASKGVPDLIVTHHAWPALVWVGIEMKGPETQVSEEQQDLANRSRIAVVRTMRDAVAYVLQAHEQLSGGGLRMVSDANRGDRR